MHSDVLMSQTIPQEIVSACNAADKLSKTPASGHSVKKISRTQAHPPCGAGTERNNRGRNSSKHHWGLWKSNSTNGTFVGKLLGLGHFGALRVEVEFLSQACTTKTITTPAPAKPFPQNCQRRGKAIAVRRINEPNHSAGNSFCL